LAIARDSATRAALALTLGLALTDGAERVLGVARGALTCGVARGGFGRDACAAAPLEAPCEERAALAPRSGSATRPTAKTKAARPPMNRHSILTVAMIASFLRRDRAGPPEHSYPEKIVSCPYVLARVQAKSACFHRLIGVPRPASHTKTREKTHWNAGKHALRPILRGLMPIHRRSAPGRPPSWSPRAPDFRVRQGCKRPCSD